MKKILIPTDLSTKSLNIIHSAVQHFNEPLDIVLFHAVSIGNSYRDILFQTRRMGQTFISNEYNTACEILRKKYQSQVTRLYTCFFYGKTVGTFNDFAEYHNADVILINEYANETPVSEFSFDPSDLIKRSKYKVFAINKGEPVQPRVTEGSTISELLLSAQGI